MPKSNHQQPPAVNAPRAPAAAHTKRKSALSMHEGVEVWQDCCCCEAEPYWLEAMAAKKEDDAPDD